MITKQIGRAMSTQLDRVNALSSQNTIAALEAENAALREQIAALRERLSSYEDSVGQPPRGLPRDKNATLHNGRPVLTWAQIARKMHYSYHQCRRYTLASGGWEHTIINGTYFVYVDQPLSPVTKQKARRKN